MLSSPPIEWLPTLLEARPPTRKYCSFRCLGLAGGVQSLVPLNTRDRGNEPGMRTEKVNGSHYEQQVNDLCYSRARVFSPGRHKEERGAKLRGGECLLLKRCKGILICPLLCYVDVNLPTPCSQKAELIRI